MKKTNAPLIIYLVLNTIIIGFVLGSLFNTSSTFVAFLFGLGVYAVSLVIALSPFGEWILRMQSGCSVIKRKDQSDYIEPIFKEVLEKARKFDSSIPADVSLYMNDSQEVNAFATGRKTVCITEGILNAPKEQIKATLSHEMGHLAHKDTDLILLVSVGNFIVTFIFIAIRMFARLMSFLFGLMAIFLGRDGIPALGASLYAFICDVILGALMWVWTKIGIMLVMKSSRDNEFEADKFAFNLGYGNALCELLDSFTGSSTTKGLFANLINSHPDKNERIAALMNLGATYSKSYGAK
ncbi:zinc metalloprotease HtpX [Methanosarcina mazei]|uniref:Peptidase M48 domain-containing protein n=1 Tax=Methanosarcina mazei TaxID=2209 RepID=A0A0F8H931_METMZ|nr:zinc metalloprotease HtpX [Methanosarcina mazei]KKG73141.1 hypothetical protein DU63_08100 [Methanosarcina mazei]